MPATHQYFFVAILNRYVEHEDGSLLTSLAKASQRVFCTTIGTISKK